MTKETTELRPSLPPLYQYRVPDHTDLLFPDHTFNGSAMETKNEGLTHDSFFEEEKETQPASGVKAEDILGEALTVLRQRASERDVKEERSINMTVKLFNTYTGLSLTPSQGWVFMICMKLARSIPAKGKKRDDWVDLAAYAALAGESFLETTQNKE